MEKDGTIMVYIALKENKIIHVCETQSEEGIIGSLAYEGLTEYDSIKQIPDDYFEGKVGNDIREFDSNYELLPLSERKDYVDIPEGMKIEGEEFVPMTVKEKIDQGLTILSDREKYDEISEQIRPKTVDELLADKIITKEQWFEIKLSECMNQRRGAYASESDPLKNEIEFDGGDLQIWKDEVSEIKARYPKPVMP